MISIARKLRREESSDEQLFIQEISQKLYPEGRYQIKEKLIFEVCYAPENMGLPTEELAEYLNNRYFDDGQRQITAARVSQLRTVVAKRLLEEFQDEMIADKVEVEKITDGGRGGSKPHEKPYRIAGDWLWRCKFSRWVVDLALKPIIPDADKCSGWIDFIPVDNCSRGIVPPPSPTKPKIKVNTSYFMSIRLPNPKGYFLLLNRGLITRYCICPSLYIAPNNEFDRDGQLLMPQETATAKDIQFNEVGKEDFIGIVVDRSLNKNWLQPNNNEQLPTLNLERITKLISELEKVKHELFDRDFNIV